MIDALVLQLEAPWMAFGGVMVDEWNKTDEFPFRSMLTGLLANALGYDHSEHERLERLQQRISYAARRDHAGVIREDFHTVDLEQSESKYPEYKRHMQNDRAWTTWGRLDPRKGADGSTHIRHRYYLEDAVVTVVLTLRDALTEEPTLATVERALREPERPLFLGRKCCLPSGPILRSRVQAESLRAALGKVARVKRADKDRVVKTETEATKLLAIWPLHEGCDNESECETIGRFEDRDWLNQYHVGRRFYWKGFVSPASAEEKSRKESES